MNFTIKEINSVIKETQEIAKRLLNKNSSKVRDIPNTQGVYLIYNKKSGKIIYVGMAKNLKRRINSDHISGEIKISTSTFRNKLNKKCGIKSGKEMRNWVINNCSFVYEEVENKDICSLVETILIVLLRKGGEPLLND